jgi:PAS domain-containing protein
MSTATPPASGGLFDWFRRAFGNGAGQQGPAAAAPAASEAAQQFLSDLVENVGHALLVLAPVTDARPEKGSAGSHFRIELANRAARELFGEAVQIVQGTIVEDIFPDFPRRGITEVLHEVLKDGKPKSFEDIHYKPNALEIILAYQFKASRLNAGNIILLIDNITEFRQAEERAITADNERSRAMRAVQQGETERQQQQKVLEAMRIGVLVVRRTEGARGPILKVQYANAALAAATGIPIAPAPNDRLEPIFPDFEARGIFGQMHEALDAGKSSTFEDVRYRDDRLEVESARSYRIFPIDSDLACLMVEDISLLKRAEDALHRSSK